VTGLFWWYLARAAGIVAWALLVAGLVWGVLLSTRVLRPHDRPAWLLDLHRWLAGLAVAMVALHIGALVADSFVHFGPADVLVPLASGWHPVAVAFGVVAAYGLVAVQATSLAMRRMPRRAWRAVHLTSYGTVWLVSVHAGLAGSDAINPVYRAAAMVLVVAATGAAVTRLLARRRPPPRPANPPRPRTLTPAR
jgi:methionine sulfoxide reductase heme-binding subunit